MALVGPHGPGTALANYGSYPYLGAPGSTWNSLGTTLSPTNPYWWGPGGLFDPPQLDLSVYNLPSSGYGNGGYINPWFQSFDPYNAQWAGQLYNAGMIGNDVYNQMSNPYFTGPVGYSGVQFWWASLWRGVSQPTEILSHIRPLPLPVHEGSKIAVGVSAVVAWKWVWRLEWRMGWGLWN